MIQTIPFWIKLGNDLNFYWWGILDGYYQNSYNNYLNNGRIMYSIIEIKTICNGDQTQCEEERASLFAALNDLGVTILESKVRPLTKEEIKQAKVMGIME